MFDRGVGQQNSNVSLGCWLLIAPLVFAAHRATHVDRPTLGTARHTAHQALNFIKTIVLLCGIFIFK
jgi:hypothetical protein